MDQVGLDLKESAALADQWYASLETGNPDSVMGKQRFFLNDLRTRSFFKEHGAVGSVLLARENKLDYLEHLILKNFVFSCDASSVDPSVVAARHRFSVLSPQLLDRFLTRRFVSETALFSSSSDSFQRTFNYISSFLSFSDLGKTFPCDGYPLPEQRALFRAMMAIVDEKCGGFSVPTACLSEAVLGSSTKPLVLDVWDALDQKHFKNENVHPHDKTAFMTQALYVCYNVGDVLTPKLQERIKNSWGYVMDEMLEKDMLSAGSLMASSLLTAPEGSFLHDVVTKKNGRHWHLNEEQFEFFSAGLSVGAAALGVEIVSGVKSVVPSDVSSFFSTFSNDNSRLGEFVPV